MDKNIVLEDKKDDVASVSKFNWIKLFNLKNIKIFVLILIGIIAVYIVMSVKSPSSSKNDVVTSNAYGYTNTLDYCAELERKLEVVLSSVKGAGNIKVMVTVDGSPELVYAKDEDEKVTSSLSGSTTSSSSSSPIIVTVGGESNALILTETLPSVKGVIVVSSGAYDVGVKLDILNAVSSLLDISIDKVSVLKGI